MPPQQRVPISERERQQIRKYAHANPQLKQADIAAWASVALGRPINQSIIHKSLHSKFSYLDTKTFAQGDSGTKRVYPADHPVLESALFEWIMHMEASNLSLTGEIIQSAASSLWQKMPDFHMLTEPAWSQGWLTGFKRRHKIKRSSKHSTSRDARANATGTAEEVQRLQQLVKTFALKDIFTADESGLFWLKAPDGTPASDGHCKNMITVLPTCNADGSQKLDLWVIGHFKNPKSFGPACRYVNKLPFTWRCNKKAWMTTAIFIEYLYWFDAQMQGRRVLLLVDTFSAHVGAVKHLKDTITGFALSNTIVEFLPTNSTFVLSPMGQGIIKNMKVHYRKAWLQYMTSIAMQGQDPYQNTTILTGIHWIINAWRSVSPDTIAHCWRHSQLFGPVDGSGSLPPGWSEQTQLQKLTQALVKEGVIRGVVNINSFVNPSEEAINDSYNDLIEHVAETFSEVEDKDINAVEQREVPSVTEAEALDAMNLLLSFEEQQDDASLAALAQLRHSRRRRVAQMGV